MGCMGCMDIEDQQNEQVDLPRTEVEGSEMCRMAAIQPDTGSVENPVSRAAVTGSGPGNREQPAASRAEGGTSISPCCFGGQREEPRAIGDYTDSANDLWTLFGTKIKSLDDAQIEVMKDKMGSALLFAGLYSAVLTGFLVDATKKLEPDPTDQIVFYLQQHSVILSQISLQLATIAPQVPISPTPPPLFPAFEPSQSDIYVNYVWFVGLISSLLAALLAISVQKWVRDNTDVFRRDSDILKCIRLRQYLRDGSDKWNLSRLNEAVPGLLEMSLLLFFVGLIISLPKINTTVGEFAGIFICCGILLYIVPAFVPIIDPRTPFQNSISGMFWYLVQYLHPRQYWDGGWRPVSIIMKQGQMQLAMEETEDRMARDGRAIRWLIYNQTEDAENEKLLMAIPGSFKSEWGMEVWRKISHTIEPKMPLVTRPSHRPPGDTISYPTVRSPSTIYPPPDTTQGEHIIRKLIARFTQFLRSSNFKTRNPLRQRRGHHAFIETTATLLFFADAEFTWFGDIADLLGDIGSYEKTRELSLAGTDQLFVTRWTCLSLLAIRRILDSDQDMWNYADEVLSLLTKDDDTGEDHNGALTGARAIDKNIQIARNCLYDLSHALTWTEDKMEVEAILKSAILKLDNIRIDAGHLENVDQCIFGIQSSIAPQITSHFPGTFDELDTAQVGFSHFVEMFRDPRQIQFIRPGQTLKSMCSIIPTLRNILEGQMDVYTYKPMQENLMEFRSRTSNWQGDELQRQLWRFQDLRHGRGFGFTVELFFLGLKRLLSRPEESQYELYMATFRAITRDWKKQKTSIGTQKLLLDIALSRSVDFQSIYPPSVTNEFLKLLGDIFKGQTGPHIDHVVQQLMSSLRRSNDVFLVRLLKVIPNDRLSSVRSAPELRADRRRTTATTSASI